MYSCNEPVSKENKGEIEQTESKSSAEQVALEFINDYVDFCNDQNSELNLIEWISKQTKVTENFKFQLIKIMSEAEKQDPELGLGFDPIFNAQDYPENGFELEKAEKESEFIHVKGKNWSDFRLKIKMEKKNKKWFVNGIGIINMPEYE